MKSLFVYLKNYIKECVMGPLFKLLEASFELLVPLVVADIIDKGIVGADKSYIISRVFILILLAVVGFTCSVTAQFFAAKAATGFATELRHSLFAHIQKLSFTEIDEMGTSKLINRMTTDVNSVQGCVNMVLRLFLRSPFIVLGAMIMAFTIDVKCALIFCVTIPLLSVVVFGVMLASIPLYKKVQSGLDSVLKITRENLTGTRVIRAFNRTKHEDKRFKDANDDLTGMVVTVQRIFASLIPIVTLLAFLLIILLVAIGYVQINRLTDPVEIQNTIGDLQAFIIYLVFVVIALTNAAAMFIMLPRAKISANRINDVLELQPEMEILPKEDNNSEKGVIEFRNVSFKYKNPDGEYTDVLKDVSFTANPGKVTAIIGGTGSGKSTILNLIPRFYDVADGAVFLDGYDVRQMDFASIYSKIGYIPQQAFLFSGTIADNLRYGKEDATDAELWHALEIAQAKDFVEKLPDGLYSMISQNGTNLSGGQKQRLCIARAIVKEALFYMFDDSFSALDFATDARLRRALKENLKNSSILIVAQRVGTIIDADKIIVLDRGQVVGTGTHEELLQSCNVYKDIVASQLSEEEATE